jgi:hypothetical protein
MSFSVVPILNQIAPVYTLRAYIFKFRFRKSFSHTCLGLPVALFPSGFTTANLYKCISISVPTIRTFTSSSCICSSSKRPHNIILSMYLFHIILGIINTVSLSSNRPTVFFCEVGSMFLNITQKDVMLRRDKSATAMLDDRSSKPTCTW